MGVVWPGGKSPASLFPITAPKFPMIRPFTDGKYAMPHPEFYRDTVLKQIHAPDHGNLDIVATVLPAARKRGMPRALVDRGTRSAVTRRG